VSARLRKKTRRAAMRARIESSTRLPLQHGVRRHCPVPRFPSFHPCPLAPPGEPPGSRSRRLAQFPRSRSPPSTRGPALAVGPPGFGPAPSAPAGYRAPRATPQTEISPARRPAQWPEVGRRWPHARPCRAAGGRLAGHTHALPARHRSGGGTRRGNAALGGFWGSIFQSKDDTESDFRFQYKMILKI
jgi:hypothetical protein